MRLVLSRRRDIIQGKITVEGIFGEIWKEKEMEYGMNEIIMYILIFYDK